MKPITSKINSTGHLEIGGLDVIELAKKHGTSLYVMDVATIRSMANKYNTIKEIYPKTIIAYASKALSITALYQVLDEEGLFFDVVSDGELFTLLNAGVSPQKVFFHGNNKTNAEIEFALSKKIGCFMVDNLYEIERLQKIYERLDLRHKVEIMIRITPEIEAHTHDFIATGKRDSKFGILKEELLGAIDYIKTIPYIECRGLHVHIGSQIFDIKPFDVVVETLLDISLDIYTRKQILMKDISIGGGIGIRYTEADDPPDIENFVQGIAKHLKSYLKKINYPLEPTLILEPGRSLVANAGVTLYTVGNIKNIPESKTYAIVDGGMADNPRPITYGALYCADIANKMNEEKNKVYTIAGKFCESGDVLIKDSALPKIADGDILVVYVTGAYNYSMSSNYNRYRKPAMVFVEGGQDKLVLRRESLSDIIRNDVKV